MCEEHVLSMRSSVGAPAAPRPLSVCRCGWAAGARSGAVCAVLGRLSWSAHDGAVCVGMGW